MLTKQQLESTVMAHMSDKVKRDTIEKILKLRDAQLKAKQLVKELK